jgi:hypothetical protein
MWITRAILRKLFKRKALLVHIIDGLRPHGAPFDLLVTKERPLFLFHDFLSSRWVRDFVNTAGADDGTSQQMFSVILEQIGVLSWKAMGALIVWVKRDMRQALSGT